MEKEFAIYLKSQNLKRFMDSVKANYKRLGHLGGTIKVEAPTREERIAVEALTGLNFLDGGDILLTYSKFEKTLEKTRYATVDFTTVLTYYFGESIITNKERKDQKQEMIENATNELFELYTECYANEWLRYIQTDNPSLFTKCINQFLINKDSLINSLDAINQLPFRNENRMSLAVFSTILTKDPHFFDKGFPAVVIANASRYFFDEVYLPTSPSARGQLLGNVGLLKEETLNYCMTSRLFATHSNGDEHNGLADFSSRFEPLNLHLGNILQLDKIIHTDQVVIVENPAVFHALNEHIKAMKLQDVALICTSGEINLASYTLLDKIDNASIKMYYAGDFDPEGLVIAEKLKKRYTRLEFLSYDVDSFHLAKSTKILDEKRLKKLDNCTESELLTIKNLLLLYKNPGYQESLIDKYSNWLVSVSKMKSKGVDQYVKNFNPK